MKVKIPGRVLHDAVKAAGNVSDESEDRQILRNVLLKADSTGLEITTTDTTVSVWLKLPLSDEVKVLAEGCVVVNAQQLQRVLGSVSDKDITVSATARSCSVTGKGSRHRLCIEDANDFPKIARFSQRKPFITIPAATMPKMVARTAFAAHTEASFFLMHGLLVTAKANELRMVATNGQRLAVTTSPFSIQSNPKEPFDAEIVIPAEQAAVVKQIVGDGVETVDVQWMANFLNLRTTKGEVSVRALAGDFPQYERGIPDQLRTLTLNRQEFIGILKQTTALKSLTTNFVALTIENKQMVFASQVDGIGDSVIEYAVDWAHDPINLTINPDFMLDTLAAVKGDSVDLELGTEMTPTLLREKQPGDLKNFCVFAVVRQ